MSGAPITVFLVDDHAMVRRGMASFLAAVDDIEVVGETADGTSLFQQLAALERSSSLPDVMLVDIVMPGMDGMEVVSRAAELYPDVRSVMISSFGDSWRVRDALSAGALGYLMKHASPEQVEAAIRAAHRGEPYLDPAAASGLAYALTVASTSRDKDITPREREVLALIAHGKSNQEIAAELVISERTARTHVSNLLQKMGFSSRTQAAVWALDAGIK